MVQICFYFQLHIPIFIRDYKVFSIGHHIKYFDEEKGKYIIQNLAQYNLYQTNKELLELIKKYSTKMKISLSISGTTIEQMEKYAPDLLDSFKELAQTNCVEFITETYYHSLSFMYSKEEFIKQVKMHSKLMKKHFNQEPKIFRNTELIYTNELSTFIWNLGFKGILAQGHIDILKDNNPNILYKNHKEDDIVIFTRNNLSEEIQNTLKNNIFIDSQHYAQKIKNETGDIINIFLDYKTFTSPNSTKFLKELITNILEDKNNSLITPSNALELFTPQEKLNVPFLLSWAQSKKDLDMWLGNRMQINATEEMFAIEKKMKEIENEELLQEWRYLTCAENFYNMHTNFDKENTKPYDTYVHFMNILNDLIIKMNTKYQKVIAQKEILKNPPKTHMQDIKIAVNE